MVDKSLKSGPLLRYTVCTNITKRSNKSIKMVVRCSNPLIFVIKANLCRDVRQSI